MPSESISLRSPSTDTARQRLLRAGAHPPAATAVIVGVGWLGGAILRLAAFMFSHMIVIDHDTCGAATVLGGVSEVADVGRPKVDVAARWARRRAAARVTPIALPVQMLGSGFWRHVARRSALAWCALDNGFAVAAATRACRLAGLPVVTANIDRARGLVRVFPSVPEAACFHCLGVGLTRIGKGCLDPLASRISSPTIAAPGIAEIVATLALHQGIAAASSSQAAYEIRWTHTDSAPLPAVTLNQLPRSRQCTQAHVAADPPRLVQLKAPTSAVTLADVREAATSDHKGRVTLDGGRLVTRLECARRCGAPAVEVLRLASTLTECDLCPRCAGEMVPVRYAPETWTGREAAVRGVTLADLGSPLWPVLRVRDCAGMTEVEVTGDRRKLLPGGLR